ncbi:diguanylate cyclase [Roseibium aggregatum]|uniref:diguanylate cyclase n=1 Tax=Roseibium aggregatum TaxID=187304 RepID=UPI001AD94D96|nr:diguanylate cyclase [Roseibium aggregatum]
MASIMLDLETSFGDLRDSILVTDPNRVIVFANKAMENLLRLKRAELVGSKTRRFFAKQSQYDDIGKLYSKSSDQERHKACPIELVLGDGTIKSVEVVSAPLYDTSQVLTGFLFIARDLSDRIALENKLSDIALTLEDALDAVSDGFALYDKEDRLVICNDNYREIYAHSAPAIFPGNRFEDILRFGLNRQQYDTGELSEEEWLGQRLEWHRQADGSVIEQNLQDGRWLRITETRTGSGAIAGIRVDITELKNAQAQAETAYKNLFLMADSISACVTEVDLSGTCVYANKTACEWFRGTSEELIGTRLRERLPWKEREIIRTVFQEARSGRKAVLETCFHFPDGIARECRVDCNPRFNDRGEVDGFVVLGTDVTDRKKTERTLSELYAITSTRELGHEDKIREILRLGCEHFDLSFGIISHVFEDNYTITHAHSPNGELVPGTGFPLMDTYCALTLDADEPIATTDAANSNFAQHPCYEIFALESYIGAPLLVDGARHGTINFTDPNARKRDFTPADIQIVRQFADWVGHEIARQRDHQALMDAKINLEKVANIDDLTQVLNRRAFFEAASKEVQRFRRTKQPFTAVMMDLDKFKDINDMYGHAVGDEVLKLFASTVKNALRAVDVFGRIGGEEFCMILSDTSVDDAMIACERLRERVVRDCQVDVVERTITCSMGLATAGRDDIEFSGLMQKADAALYEAKASGRNKCVPYSEAPLEQAPAYGTEP